MGMFDQEIPEYVSGPQRIRRAGSALGDQLAPGVERMTGYVSPKREAKAIANSTDLSSMASIQDSYKKIQKINPTGASSWLKDVMTTFKADTERRKIGATKGTPIKAEEAHLKATRDKYIKDKGPEEGEKAFGAYLRVKDTKMQGTLPTGTRMTPDGRLEYIPGGPQEAEAAQNKELAKQSQLYISEQAGFVVQEARELEKYVTENDTQFNPIFGMTGKAAGIVPGSNRADTEASITRIYASIGFDKLQKMRDLSPTGGALGQVSERELDQLNNSMASLSLEQSPEQFTKNLRKVISQYEAIMTKAAETGDGSYRKTSSVFDSLTTPKNNNTFGF